VPTIILDRLDGTPPLSIRWSDDLGNGVGLLPGALGLELAPRTLKTRARIVGDGVDVVRPIVGMRELTFPLYVEGTSHADYLVKRRRLQAILASRSGLRVTHVEDDGETMWAQGHYVGGMEGDGGRSAGGATWQLYAPVLRCGDPYWHMPEVNEPFVADGGTSWFPFPPLQLRGSLLQERRTVDNPGDVDSWPLWTVTGPGNGFAIIHHGSGQTIEYDATVPAGQVVKIDTRPGSRSVTDAAGTNLMPNITTDPEFFPLLGGANDLELVMPGTGDASDVTLTWTPLRESV
jgi:Phage tail protein